jgi:uncharacterized protein
MKTASPTRFSPIWMVGALLTTLLLYAITVEPNWIAVTNHSIFKPTGSRQTPVRIVQISDLHIQRYGRLEKSVVERVRQLVPDVIVLTGDIVDRADTLPALEMFLNELRTTPTLAVLGNWEHWSKVDLSELSRIYAGTAGSRILINETIKLRIRGRNIAFTGLDDFTAGQPNAQAIPLFTNSDTDTRVVLQHSPGIFSQDTKSSPAFRADLCLSGHTHGGQVTLFGKTLWTPPGSGPFNYGWYQTETCPLYVSRGIGTSIAPMRFGARPEIALFEI